MIKIASIFVTVFIIASALAGCPAHERERKTNPCSPPPACGVEAETCNCDGICYTDDGSISKHLHCLRGAESCRCVPKLKPCVAASANRQCRDAYCLRADGSPDPAMRCRSVGVACACVPAD